MLATVRRSAERSSVITFTSPRGRMRGSNTALDSAESCSGTGLSE